MADNKADSVEQEAPVSEDAPEEKPKRKRRTAPSTPPPENPCDNHPDREAVWESDGVTASVVRLCSDCKKEFTT